MLEAPRRALNLDGVPMDEIFDSGEVAGLGFVDWLIKNRDIEPHTDLTPVSEVMPNEPPRLPNRFLESARRIATRKEE